MARHGVAVEVTERRLLSMRAKGLIALGVVLVLGLVVAIVATIRAKGIEEEKRRQTRVVLAEVRELVDFHFRPQNVDPVGIFEGLGWDVTSDEAEEDAGGLGRLRQQIASSGAFVMCDGPNDETLVQFRDGKSFIMFMNAACKRILEGSGVVRDGWGNPIIYRCPGPVHRHGWDLYSFGPNGVDEQGGGDDILMGEDVAEVGSKQ